MLFLLMLIPMNDERHGDVSRGLAFQSSDGKKTYGRVISNPAMGSCVLQLDNLTERLVTLNETKHTLRVDGEEEEMRFEVRASHSHLR